jgi:hypothetical protein
MTNIKRIAEYLGAEYKQGGDICSTIENKIALENEIALMISVPQEPALIGIATELLVSHKLIFKEQIHQYIRREAILQENMQRTYSVVLGQCTELLRAKLKQSSDWWAQVSSAFDVLGLTKLIKSIVFKFDDQKFLLMSWHQAKHNFYSLRQGTMTNAEYQHCQALGGLGNAEWGNKQSLGGQGSCSHRYRCRGAEPGPSGVPGTV